MRWWWPPSDDPGDGPPPSTWPVVYSSEDAARGPTEDMFGLPANEWDTDAPIDNKTPRLVSVKEVGEWMTAAEEREFMVWKQIDDLLLELKPFWPLRTRAIRRELRWLRKEAKRRNYDWGKDADT